MTPILAILDSSDYAVIVAIVIIFSGSASFAKRRHLRSVERKLDALLKHQGVDLSSLLSPEVQFLARDPSKKIAAIKLHRDQNPDLNINDAKREVESLV